MTTHELKTWPESFNAIREGRKTFEYRRHDWPFEEGDILRLREYDPTTDSYTGRAFDVRVTYLLLGNQLGIPQGYCIMSIVIHWTTMLR